MGWFGKGSDTLDLTTEQNKRLLEKVKESEGSGIRADSEGVVDLSSMGFSNSSSSSSSNNTSVASSSESSNPLGFSMSGFDTPSSNTDSSAGVMDRLREARSSGSDNLEIQGLKNKIEDIEYKLDRFIEKIDKLEEKLS